MQKKLIESTMLTSPALAQVLNVSAYTVKEWRQERVKMPENFHKDLENIAKIMEKIREKHKSRKSVKILCNETGETFKTQTEAAKALNVSRTHISGHLADRKGHATVKGYTFKYVDN